VAAFNRISQYDGAISDYLSAMQIGDEVPAGTSAPTLDLFPGQSQRPLRRSCKTCATAKTATSRPRCTATCTPRPARW